MLNTLIALVLSLLVQVQSPNVPVQFKIQALQIANQILLVAKAEQAAQSITTEAVTPVLAPTLPVDTASPPADTGSVSQDDQATSTGAVAPTCSFWAQAVNLPNMGWRVQFGWVYTQGAYATISTGGQVVAYPNKGTTFNSSALAGPLYYYIFGPTDYEMDVTLNGVTGSCTAHATVPATPPQN